MSLQAQIYKNDLMMSLGSDTRPPVLINENEFEQWQDRFINFIERQPNGENMMKSLTQGPMEIPRKVVPATTTSVATSVDKALREYDADEMLRHQADSQAKSNLILALPNSIYNRIDCFKHNPMMMWTQLEKIMLGTAMSTQLRQTRYMNNFEKFKAKDGESLKNVFDRFLAVINDLYKIKVTKTELEANLKFLNDLQPEWNKSCHRMRNDVRISTMPIQELYEILMTDESMVMEKKAKLDKKNKPLSVDPIALLASQLDEQALTETTYDGSTHDDGEALEKAMILLTQHYQKRFKHKSGSNNLRFTSGSKKIEHGAPSKTYTPKYEPTKLVEQKKDEKKVVNCFNCGKPGHMVKDCRVKVVKDAAFYRKKLALAEKKESGTILLAEEEYWLDHSDNEAENEETAAMCFIGDDKSDDEEADTSSDDFVDIFANTDKENVSPVSYDTKKYIPPLVLECKIVDIEDRLEEQNLQTCLENNLFLFIMKTSFEDKISSGLSKDSKENSKVLKNNDHLRSTLETQTESLRVQLDAQSSVCASNGKRKPPPDLCNFENFHTKASSSMSNVKTDFFDKVSSSDSIIDNSLLLNAQFYKKKRKRRRSKKSKKHDTVLSENSNVSDFSSSDQTVRKSSRQIWRMKQQILESELLGVTCLSQLWNLDSGCSKHMTGNKSLLSNFKDKCCGRVKFVNCETTPILGYGDLVQDLEVSFKSKRVAVKNDNSKDLLVGKRQSNLYTIDLSKIKILSDICLLSKASIQESWIWHRRLAHLNFKYMDRLVKNDSVRGLPVLRF
ncbi:hypothetical protein L6452_42077 [Arctium lappa]|uniref:Uncharacterized protein n=1 Tax=Arctium lappa TaxID=4217 RepID=A0ACB8XJ13_ARCLA|nr:hypothetical protein L6452_42077 [Arctium lappa]